MQIIPDLLGFTMERFWRWDYFGEYLAFLGTFVVGVAVLTFFNKYILGSAVITESVGGLALMVESTLAMPQFYQNLKTQSAAGLR